MTGIARTTKQVANCQWRFWIDRGGTFTDVVATSDSGEVRLEKLLSSDPGHYDDAAIEAIRRVLQLKADQPIPDHQIAEVKMGTTVATNALLEHQGAKVALVTNKGFADAWRIGYQHRRDIFAQAIEKPFELYQQIVEVDARIDAQGNELIALSDALVAEQLLGLRAAGIESVAIVLLHGWQFPATERRIAELAQVAGFSNVSTSAQVSPLIKLISRGDTTLVDAYLTPILQRYLVELGKQINTDKLFFMQSHGGLTPAASFRGHNSILSGPAGGLVGLAGIAKHHTCSAMIGFDMGGTSTDVSLYRGELEPTFDGDIAGFRIRAPMLPVHTVAAGGGSVVHYTDARMQIGPQSAGASPGPACYGNGGPLTITDMNLLLGRIRPEYFPKVFGPERSSTLSSNATIEKAEQLLTQINAAETSGFASTSDMAAGFMEIATNTMAGAVRRISIEKGFDPATATLCGFGGAGAQHACLVAESLGMRSVIIPHYAGVLSAYGMGLADQVATRTQSIMTPLPNLTEKRVIDLTQLAAAECAKELSLESVPEPQIRLHLSYLGSETTLPVQFASHTTMREQFSAQHREIYGFIQDDTPLQVHNLETRVVRPAASATAAISSATGTTQPIDKHSVWFKGGESQASFYAGETVPAGQVIAGPAVILDDNTTIVVEPDWTLRRAENLDWLLTREASLQPKGNERRSEQVYYDPVRLGIFGHLYMQIAEEMGLVLEKTAHSVNIKERLDFSCALFDRQGNLIANAPHMPVHLGSMGASVEAVLEHFPHDMASGDVFVLNSPYAGGTHLPDITVVTPMFHKNEIVALVASRGHHADVGGISPASMPSNSQHICEEGILLEPAKLVTSDVFQEQDIRQKLAAGRYPARAIDQNIADLKAQIAANNAGIKALIKAFDEFGRASVLAYMSHVLDNAETAVVKLISELEPGSFCYPMDNGCQISVTITPVPARQKIVVDFTGTSAQHHSNFNAPSSVARAAVLYVFRALLDRDVPLNAGCLRPIEIIIPPDSLLSPEYPAAVVAGNVETSQCVTDALWGALGVQAGAQGTMNNLSFGNASYQYYETIAGGSGAGILFNGTDVVQTHMTNSRLTDPEILEARFPVRLQEFSIRHGSGGQGRFCGGNGGRRVLEFLEPMSVSMLANNRDNQPYGASGGEPGKSGSNKVLRKDGTEAVYPASFTTELDVGDTLIIETPGGGGFGDSNH